jgi:YesN/AraC family two-component response regulator
MASVSDHGPTVLVVDDDPRMHDLYARMLSSLVPDCQIVAAMDGREALEVMDQQRPDLVLLDLVMPRLDGYAVLEAMQEDPRRRDVPVIVLTAQILTEHDMTRLRRGVDAVLAKGLYSGDELLEQIELVLRRNKRLCGDTQWAMRQTMAYIHENYSKPISRAELAAHAALSERYLTQCFRHETGLTPIKYLNRYRIRQACDLLTAGDKNITEVALEVGFADPSYFARVFREEIGISPRAYQVGERPRPTDS